MKLDIERTKDDLIQWVRWFFEPFGSKTKAVIGISGGKDSTVAATLLCEALGKDRVVGVSIPNGNQSDMADVDEVFEFTGIRRVTVNIQDAFVSIQEQVKSQGGSFSTQSHENLPPRLRMSVLYAVAQSVGGLVVNTCNLSEDYVGWATKWGDSAGDFSPFMYLTKTEVCELGVLLGVPTHLVEKVPSDGLCGFTDEEKFGFTYQTLDQYIRGDREGIPNDVQKKIEQMHEAAKHKDLSQVIPHYLPGV